MTTTATKTATKTKAPKTKGRAWIVARA